MLLVRRGVLRFGLGLGRLLTALVAGLGDRLAGPVAHGVVGTVALVRATVPTTP